MDRNVLFAAAAADEAADSVSPASTRAHRSDRGLGHGASGSSRSSSGSCSRKGSRPGLGDLPPNCLVDTATSYIATKRRCRAELRGVGLRHRLARHRRGGRV